MSRRQFLFNFSFLVVHGKLYALDWLKKIRTEMYYAASISCCQNMHVCKVMYQGSRSVKKYWMLFLWWGLSWIPLEYSMYTLELNLFVVCQKLYVWFQVDQGLFQGNIHVLCLVKDSNAVLTIRIHNHSWFWWKNGCFSLKIQIFCPHITTQHFNFCGILS